MLKEENMTKKEMFMLKEVEEIKLKPSRKKRRKKSIRKQKTKTIKERKIEVNIKLLKNERSRKRDNRIEINKILVHIQ